jgi:hypothetical protein
LVAVVVADPDAFGVADADVFGVAVEAEGVGDGVAVLDGVVGGLADAEALGLLGVLELVVGLGVGLEATVTDSHCDPEGVADTSASAGVAVAALNAIAETPVTSIPPATRLVATGRTRVKHMEDVLPVLFVAPVERLSDGAATSSTNRRVRCHTHI